MVEVLPENYLSILVLRLEVVGCNAHDTLVDAIVDVACHDGPMGNSFDMVGYNPSIYKITTRFHLLHQIDTIA